MNYDKHLNIRISQEQLDWLDERSDQSKQSTSEIIRNLIDKEIYLEEETTKHAPCDHSDIGDFHCLDCGKDMSEDITSLAFERAKGLAKYGE